MKPQIKAALFDLDNTLIDTHAVFTKKIEELLQLWKKNMDDTPIETVKHDFDSLFTEGFRLYSVNPKRLWPHVLEGLTNKYDFFSPLIQQSWDIITSIYTHLPLAFPGAAGLLRSIQKSDIPIGLVTHAEKEWTNFKIDGHDLRQYFDEIIVCDVNRPKDASDWKQAIDAFGLRADETILFGDSIPGDILPAHGLGVKHLMWVNVSHGWHIYKQGTLPEGIVEINDLQKVSVESVLFR